MRGQSEESVSVDFSRKDAGRISGAGVSVQGHAKFYSRKQIALFAI